MANGDEVLVADSDLSLLEMLKKSFETSRADEDVLQKADQSVDCRVCGLGTYALSIFK